MKMKNLLVGLILTVALIACSKDDEAKKAGSVDCTSFPTEIQTLITNITNAATAYGQEQSKANCTAYYDALEAYITGIESYINKCVPDQAALYQSSIDTYRSYVDDLTCE